MPKLLKNLWNNIELYCGNHEDDVLMHIQEGPLSPFYACPKYYPENRSETERACVNRINLIEYEKMVEHIQKLLAEAEENGQELSILHHKWKQKMTFFEVIGYEPHGKIKIAMINKTALR